MIILSKIFFKDIDECAMGYHKCPIDTICVNEPGSYHCDCNAGLIFINNKCVG